MTDQLPPRSTGAFDRELYAPRPAPEAPSDWPHDLPVPPRGGSDPTTPPLELDPDALAAMLPRSRWS